MVRTNRFCFSKLLCSLRRIYGEQALFFVVNSFKDHVRALLFRIRKLIFDFLSNFILKELFNSHTLKNEHYAIYQRRNKLFSFICF